MAIKQKDIKLLWGRSGNRCAICQTELVQDSLAQGAAFTLGEMAHIVGEKESAARGKSTLPLDKRNSYHNLILLCPNDHTKVDSNEFDWSIEKLYLLKSEHELWVKETLSSSTDLRLQANEVIVTNIIDTTTEVCKLGSWKEWASMALAHNPRWEKDFDDKIHDQLHKVNAAIWPEEFPELRNATKTLVLFLYLACNEFLEHAVQKGEYMHAHKFYKDGYNENYHSDLERYREWVKSYRHLVLEATKAANWFADVVRRDVNPLFFAEHGKFVVEEGYGRLGIYFDVLQFTEEEKQNLPDSLLNLYQDSPI